MYLSMYIKYLNGMKIAKEFNSVLLKWCSIHRSISTSSDGIVMSYNKYDVNYDINKPPVMIMHGLFGSKSNWQSVAKALNKTLHRLVYTVDARNHGASPHKEEFNYEALATDIKRTLDELSLKNVCLMGHSMGGRAAMLFSLKFPEYVHQLVVIDISPVSSSDDLNSLFEFFNVMKSVKLNPSLSSSEGRKEAAKQMRDKIQSTMIVDFLVTNLVKTQSGEFKWRINLDAIERNFSSGIFPFPKTDLTFNKPVLFIAGKKSDYLPPSHESKILDIFPMSKFVYLNTGHWVHAEDPAGVISNVVKFLED